MGDIIALFWTSNEPISNDGSFRENGTERMYSWSLAEEGVLVDLGVWGN